MTVKDWICLILIIFGFLLLISAVIFSVIIFSPQDSWYVITTDLHPEPVVCKGYAVVSDSGFIRIHSEKLQFFDLTRGGRVEFVYFSEWYEVREECSPSLFEQWTAKDS